MRDRAKKPDQEMDNDRAKDIRNWGLAVKEWIGVISGVISLTTAMIVLHEKIKAK